MTTNSNFIDVALTSPPSSPSSIYSASKDTSDTLTPSNLQTNSQSSPATPSRNEDASTASTPEMLSPFKSISSGMRHSGQSLGQRPGSAISYLSAAASTKSTKSYDDVALEAEMNKQFLQDMNKDFQKETQLWSKKLKGMRFELGKAEDEKARLNAEIRKRDRQIDELERSVLNLETQIEMDVSKRMLLDEERKATLKYLQDLQDDLAIKSTAPKALEHELLRARIEELNNELDAMDQKHEADRLSLEEATTDAELYRLQLEEAEERIKQLEADFETAKFTIDANKAFVTALAQENKQLKAELAQLKADLEKQATNQPDSNNAAAEENARLKAKLTSIEKAKKNPLAEQQKAVRLAVSRAEAKHTKEVKELQDEIAKLKVSAAKAPNTSLQNARQYLKPVSTRIPKPGSGGKQK